MSQVKKIPMRKCVGCQEMKSKREMIRILKTESEGIILDATGKKNGRGAYICRSGECLEKAIRNHGIERSLKTGILPEIYDSLKKEIEKSESEESALYDRSCPESRKNGQRRIFYGKIGQNGLCSTGYRIHGIFGQYKEEVPEYVRIL